MLPDSPPSKRHKDLGIQTGLCLCVDLNRGIQVLGVGSYIFKILLEVDGRTWNFELDLCPDLLPMTKMIEIQQRPPHVPRQLS